LRARYWQQAVASKWPHDHKGKWQMLCIVQCCQAVMFHRLGVVNAFSPWDIFIFFWVYQYVTLSYMSISISIYLIFPFLKQLFLFNSASVRFIYSSFIIYLFQLDYGVLVVRNLLICLFPAVIYSGASGVQWVKDHYGLCLMDYTF
jgi:hypothetical protein